MAIDEIAEQVIEQCCAEAGDIAFYSEDRGYVEIGTPRAILVVDPIDGTRPAAAGFESCCVSVAVLPPSRDATLGDVEFGVVHEIKSGQRFFATRGEGARASSPTDAGADRAVGEHRSRRAVLDRRSARPARGRDGRSLLEDLIDGSSMHGGYFDLGSHVQHDADRHRPARRLRRHRLVRRSTSCRELEARVPARGRRRGSARTFPTTSRPPR